MVVSIPQFQPFRIFIATVSTFLHFHCVSNTNIPYPLLSCTNYHVSAHLICHVCHFLLLNSITVVETHFSERFWNQRFVGFVFFTSSSFYFDGGWFIIPW